MVGDLTVFSTVMQVPHITAIQKVGDRMAGGTMVYVPYIAVIEKVEDRIAGSTMVHVRHIAAIQKVGDRTADSTVMQVPHITAMQKVRDRTAYNTHLSSSFPKIDMVFKLPPVPLLVYSLYSPKFNLPQHPSLSLPSTLQNPPSVISIQSLV